MKKCLFLFAFIITGYPAKTQCLVNSLTINTAYNPVTGFAIPGGANGATPVTDPYWILTAETPTVPTAISLTALPGLIAVIPGNNANIITKVFLWSSNPFGQPGGWISCLNSNYYVTDGTGITIYEMTLGRPFRVCSDDSIVLDFYIASDNNISSTNIDGIIPLTFSEPALPLLTYFSTFTHFTQTVFLTAGTHTVNIVVNNLNQVSVSVNQTGLNVYGTVSSKTGKTSLVSESNPACVGYICPTVSVTCNDSISLPDSLQVCKNSTFTLPAIFKGTDPVTYIHWSPPLGLSDTSIFSPSLTVSTTSGWYYLTVGSIVPGNLVVNGDFSAGNTGFLSPDYTYLSTIPFSNEYTISTDIFLADPGIGVHFNDHTNPPTGNMMALNGGSPTANSVAWQETIPVSAGYDYLFTAWYAYWTYDPSGISNPNLFVKITPVGAGIPATYTFAALGSALNWQQVIYKWTAPSGATGAIIQIIDQCSSYLYNDFCLDDISFQQLCITKDSIYIEVSLHDTIYNHSDITVCASSGPLTLNAPAGYSSYLWNAGSTASNISVNTTGVYWVDAFKGSCSMYADTFYTTFIPSPVISLGNDTAICNGTEIALSSVQPAGAVFKWSNGSNAPSIYISNSGSYSLTVTINGCSASDAIQVTEISPPVVNLGADTTLCTGDILPLLVNANQATYLWSDGGHEQSLQISETGTYWTTISNICGTASDTINVTYDFCDIWFPSAFTPNGDGRNDIIRVVGSLAEYKDFSLSIFNRFGQRVFFTQDIYSGWDGIFYGSKQDLGTYFYMIYYTLKDKKHMMKGDFQLIR